TVYFIRDSAATYARGAFPFVADSPRVVIKAVDLVRGAAPTKKCNLHVEAMTLQKRAPKSQGVALLILYTKSFSPHTTFFGKLVGEYKVSQKGGKHRIIDLPKQIRLVELCNARTNYVWTDRSLHLHLFLHARSLLSAAVRLNTIGPYASQQLLLHVIRPVVDVEFDIWLRTLSYPGEEIIRDEGVLNGPATTWPLGEILASRHDLQHSRIFNS
ncbi:hypothetical protein BJ322DRAFT_1008690, partial [Thelephora terrestris]